VFPARWPHLASNFDDHWRSLWQLLMFLAMSALLDNAIAAIRQPPDTEQEAIAREVLECIEADHPVGEAVC
jgi:hypothetical protein